jgi:hypothetical protein
LTHFKHSIAKDENGCWRATDLSEFDAIRRIRAELYSYVKYGDREHKLARRLEATCGDATCVAPLHMRQTGPVPREVVAEVIVLRRNGLGFEAIARKYLLSISSVVAFVNRTRRWRDVTENDIAAAERRLQAEIGK